MPMLISGLLTIQVGVTELGPFAPPASLTKAQITYDCAAWPSTEDGQITAIIMRSDDGGANYADVWQDTFQHVRQVRAAITQAQGSFGVSLASQFTTATRLKVRFVSTVLFATTVTVDAN